MFNLDSILSAVKLVGASTPAFKAIFDSAVTLFGEQDQAKLKSAYDDAIRASDDAHRDAQDALR